MLEIRKFKGLRDIVASIKKCYRRGMEFLSSPVPGLLSPEKCSQFFHSVLENMPNIVFVKDKNLRFVYLNKAAEIVFGPDRDLAVGKTDYDYFPKEQADFFTAQDRKVMKQKIPYEIPEEPVDSQEQVTRFFCTRKIPILNKQGEAVYLLGIAEDITERKAAEEELLDINADLEKIVEQRTRDLQATIDQLKNEIQERKRVEVELNVAKNNSEAASLAKSRFLANMSHEIRTPLGIVQGYTELLLQAQLLESQKTEFLEVINRNSQLLETIISDILDLSKVEAGKLQIQRERVSTEDLISDLESQLELSTKGKNLRYELVCSDGLPNAIKTDPHRLRQILLNIIGNATKFTHYGFINVLVQKVAGKLSFIIKDSGPGIPEEKREMIFDPFVQADNSTTREFGGSGLGLHLSRRLAQALGGNVELVDSAPGKGSVFKASVAIE